jgi:hypothetical protein
MSFKKEDRVPFAITAAIALCLAVGGLIYKYKFNSSNSSGRINSDNIKNQSDLNAYVRQNANDKCEAWHKDNNLVNETNKAEALTFDDNWINNFSLTIIPDIVQNNDLPNSYIDEARKVFEETLNNCGYKYHLYH